MNQRVVVDTNVYLSAILFAGVPAALLLAASRGECSILTSEPILHEIERKLIQKFKRELTVVRSEIEQIRLLAEIVKPTEIIAVCRDEDDNRILECATASKADIVVTRDLLILASFRSIPILTPRQFLDRLSTTQVPLK